jgi:hypothetical protein
LFYDKKGGEEYVLVRVPKLTRATKRSKVLTRARWYCDFILPYFCSLFGDNYLVILKEFLCHTLAGKEFLVGVIQTLKDEHQAATVRRRQARRRTNPPRAATATTPSTPSTATSTDSTTTTTTTTTTTQPTTDSSTTSTADTPAREFGVFGASDDTSSDYEEGDMSESDDSDSDASSDDDSATESDEDEMVPEKAPSVSRQFISIESQARTDAQARATKPAPKRIRKKESTRMPRALVKVWHELE